MSFVFEKVPEKDHDFFKSMGLKNCWGNGPHLLISETQWCADREKNAYLVGIGGGHDDMPHFQDLWWNGYVIRMETNRGGKGNYDVGVDIIWFIEKISIPKSIWQYRETIIKMIEEAFAVDYDWCNTEYLKSISVHIDCEPTMEEDNYY